jgi:hypothetical protein
MAQERQPTASQSQTSPARSRAKKCPEGSKHDDIVVSDLAAQTGADRSDIHERLVYHQQAASPASFR